MFEMCIKRLMNLRCENVKDYIDYESEDKS